MAILYETLLQVRDLENSVEEIQEKIWELDKSWKNNLVFYGIRSDTLEEHPSVTESKIREIIARLWCDRKGDNNSIAARTMGGKMGGSNLLSRYI